MNKAIIAAALLAAAPAIAQQEPASANGGEMQGGRMGGGPMGGGMLRMADRNGDGIVTREEYAAAVDARFARMDRNGDGVLEPDEMPMRGGPGGPGGPGGDTPPPPPPPPNGSAADATGMPPAPPPPSGARGPVTRAQYREMAMRRFDRWDTNHDGRIDGAEMAAASQRGPRPGAGRGGEMPPPRGQ